MRTRITQEEAYQYLKSLPKEISREEFQHFHNKSLHLKVTSKKLQFTFTEEPLEDTFHLPNFKLSYFYKGQDVKKRVPLQVGSMALWTTVYQYMATVQAQHSKEEGLPFNLQQLKYIGTTDESEGVSSISSNQQLPYRLTHTFFTDTDEEVLFIQDFYEHPKPTTKVYYQQEFYECNYLEEDKLTRQSSRGQSITSELSKRIKQERELYRVNDAYECDDSGLEDLDEYEIIYDDSYDE